MKPTIHLILAALLITITACSSKQTTKSTVVGEADESQTIVDGHTSQNSIDWWGTYTGIIPCADCEGIKTTITLYREMTYSMTAVYLGKDENEFFQQGAFSWNDAGSIIVLADAGGSVARFFVGENQLFQLDQEGNRITGSLADSYMLKKQTEPEKPGYPSVIEASGWQLIELMGKPVQDNVPGKKSPDMIFNRTQGRVAGFAGCNQYFGSYELMEYNRINIEKIGSTMMACPEAEMILEQEFMKVLELADNFEIRGNTLILYKARTAPLARFRSINIEKD
jgi:copper homeostasis protein (lipoprotein)